MFAVFVNLSPI